MSGRLTVLAFRAAWWLVPRLPESLVARVADVLADIFFLRNGRGVRRLQGNLARVIGRPFEDPATRDLTRRAMRSYARYWRELFALDGWSDEEVARRVRLVGFDHVLEAATSGAGVIIALPHSGNWDLAGAHMARRLGGVSTVAERLEPEELFEAFLRARVKYDIEILPHAGGDASPFAVLLDRVKAGRVVALVSDRDLSSRGIEVRFFGETARMAAGPAALAVASGAPLVPASIWNDGDTIVIEAKPALAIPSDATVASVTQQLADEFARMVSAHPADWHMLQRVWVHGRSGA